MQKFTVLFLLAFGLGVMFASFWNFGKGFSLLFMLLGAIFLLFASKPHFRNTRTFLLLAILFFAFGGGILRYTLNERKSNLSLLESQVNSRLTMRGIIADEPDERENYTRLLFDAQEIYTNNSWNKINTKILITANRYPLYRYGDLLELNGVIKRPKNLNQKDSIQNFDWRTYLAKDDIFFESFYPDLKKISEGEGFWLKRQLFSLKERFLANLGKVVPEPHISFLGGVTVGARRAIPKDVQDNFLRTGITHIVVLSGYNITVVADSIMRFLNLLTGPQLLSAGFGILGIILFALLTGASATVVRASIMAVLVILARSTGRIYEAIFALLIAGFFMLLQNPKILRFDVSFQLSFLATLALIYLSPVLDKFFHFVPNKFKIREVTVATISTQLFVLPFILYKMGTISLVSLPTNLLILTFIPLTMFFGLLTGLAGFISSVLSAPFSWIVYGLLSYELWIADIFAKLPFAFFTISTFSLWLMLLVYIGYAIGIYRLKKNYAH